MSNELLILLAAASGGVFVAVVAILPALQLIYMRKRQFVVDETWRDDPPRLVGKVRKVLDAITNNATAGLINNRLSKKTNDRLEKLLAEAGYAYSVMVAELVMVKITGTILGALFGGFLIVVYGIPLNYGLQLVLIICAVLYCYPEFWLRKQARQRKFLLEKQFPFFLDVLVLTMRAGLAFSAALEHSVNTLPKGPVKQEFGRALSEIRCGVGRTEALKRVAERVRIPALANFIAVVSQAEESGGSLTLSLNEQAKQRRRERFQKAEKMAGQAPVKLLVPLFVFIFPILFIIIGVPIALDLMRSGLFA